MYVGGATVANRLNDHSGDVVNYQWSNDPGMWRPTPANICDSTAAELAPGHTILYPSRLAVQTGFSALRQAPNMPPNSMM